MPRIWDELGIRIINFKKDRYVKESQTKAMNSMLYQKTLPLGIAVLVLCWLLAPTTYSIIAMSTFNLWNFNLLSTMFVLINISIFMMVIVLAVTFVRLLRRKKLLTKHFSQVD